jgi:outer membrane protein assembly factor BamD
LRPTVAILCAFLCFVPAFASAGSGDEVTPRERFELGQRYAKRGYTTKALEIFNRIRNYNRDDPVAVDAELAIADLYYQKGEYEQARLAYDDFARLHKRSAKLDYVVYRSAQSLFKRAPVASGRDQTSTRQAVASLTGFEVRFPESQYKEQASSLLRKGTNRLAAKELVIARFYARRDAWVAARRRAEGLVEKYPESKHAAEALYLTGRAWHEWGIDAKAHEAREKLALQAPDSRMLSKLDHVLESEPGLPPASQTFMRPYRVSASVTPQ